MEGERARLDLIVVVVLDTVPLDAVSFLFLLGLLVLVDLLVRVLAPAVPLQLSGVLPLLLLHVLLCLPLPLILRQFVAVTDGSFGIGAGES